MRAYRTENNHVGEAILFPYILFQQVGKVGLKMATATNKSNMTVYLSCSNVRSAKTYCEVKLKVCVPVHYEMVVIWRIVRITCVL